MDPRVALSKRLAHALRHDPGKYGLTLDAEGWAALPDVLAALRVSRADVDAVLALAGKRRFEVSGERVRARYGHSVAERVAHPEAVPPDVLFHGTSAATVPAIRAGGLKPMGRQRVHLSADRETAVAVGRRRRGPVAVLVVDARAAYAAGVRFNDSGDGVWLAEPVPAAFVRDDG